jgi:hypothetical protein
MDRGSVLGLLFIIIVLIGVMVLIVVTWRDIVDVLVDVLVSLLVVVKLAIWIGLGLLVLYGSYLGYNLVLGL